MTPCHLTDLVPSPPCPVLLPQLPPWNTAVGRPPQDLSPLLFKSQMFVMNEFCMRSTKLQVPAQLPSEEHPDSSSRLVPLQPSRAFSHTFDKVTF